MNEERERRTPYSSDATCPVSAVPRRELTLFDSTSIILGIIIGAGIYRMSPVVAQNVPNAWWLLALWLLGGVFSLIGALCYAELGTAYPKEGGDYVYLTRAFGRSVGFLFAWCQLWIVRPGSIGVMAYAFAEFANHIWPRAEGSNAGYVLALYAAGSIVVLTLVNILGVREGKWMQNTLTTAKVFGLGAIVAVGFFNATPQSSPLPTNLRSVPGEGQGVRDAPPTIHLSSDDSPHPNPLPKGEGTIAETEKNSGFSLTNVGLAMIFVLFTYGGWNEMAYVGAEVKEPRKNILRALLIGTVAVTAIYLLVNLAFLHAVGFEGARHATVAADVLELGMGPWAGVTISLLICISALGAVNGQIFTGARIYYAMGSEHRLYAWLGRWNARVGTPVCSLVIQGAITLALTVWFGLSQNGFESMVKFTTPGFWFFLMLVGVAVFVLRWREPTTERPYLVPGYPVTPILFCLSSGFMVYASMAYAVENGSWEAFWSIGVLLVGVAMSFYNPQRQIPPPSDARTIS